jgi:hypothetical protein
MPVSGGRWVRWGAAAVFLIAAFLAILSTTARALDVQGNDTLARAVSGPYTQQKLEALSQQMVVGKKPLDPAALAAARRDFIRHPLSADALFLTGASRKLSGDKAGATKLVDLAVTRNPRFLPARYWRIGDQLERKHVPEATDAALRIIVLDPDQVLATIPLLVKLTNYRESWPKIRAAIPNGENWREIYFNKLNEAGFDPSIVFSAIDVVRASSGKPPSIREQSALLASMTQKADFDRAYTAWLGWLPPDALGKVAYLYDGGFTGAPGAAPFNWTLGTSGDGAGLIEHEHGLRFDFSPTAAAQIAAETVLMPPGKYRLTSFSTLDQEVNQDIELPLQWQVMCLPKRNVVAQLRLPNSAASKGVAAVFEIAPDCLAQTVSLEGNALEFPLRVGGYVRSIAIEKAK